MTEFHNSWPGVAYVALLAYMLGSISGSLIMGQLRGVDIRTMGSGNAGGTNAFRTQGSRFALLVVLVDIGKGAMAVVITPWLVGMWTPLHDAWAVAFAGLGAVIGHIWPLYHRFRGGKGAATAVGVVLAWQPWFALPMFLVWLAVLIVTGWVSAATLSAALSLPLLHATFGFADFGGYVLTVGLLLLVIWAHRSNLVRLWSGEEYRFERARLWHRRRSGD